MRRISAWVVDHDNKKLFIVLYIGLSLLLSVMVSLFWLLFAVLLHLAFELVRQSRRKQGKVTVLLESLWETKLDFALVIFALWLSVYLDYLFGVAGLGAAARGGVHATTRSAAAGGNIVNVGTRIVAWQNIIRSVMFSLDEVVIAVKALLGRRKRKKEGVNKVAAADEDNHDPSSHSWRMKWTWPDVLVVTLLVVLLSSILLAPWLIEVSWQQILDTMTSEFHPTGGP